MKGYMKHQYITVVVLHEKAGLRIVGKIPATHQDAFQQAMKDGLALTFPIYETRIIVTPTVGDKVILVPK